MPTKADIVDPLHKPLELAQDAWDEDEPEEASSGVPESGLFLFLSDLSSSFASRDLSL
jgi:hypothetical protein